MANRQRSNVLQHLRRAALLRDGAGLSDGQLLDGFVARRDAACFEALVRRHGPMVLGVCRRVLHDFHDAEDAFQATFFLLARKAGAIVKRESLSCWRCSTRSCRPCPSARGRRWCCATWRAGRATRRPARPAARRAR